MSHPDPSYDPHRVVRAPFIPRPYVPAWWLPGPNAQTVAGRYLREATGVHYRRERIETPDGDFFDIDFATIEGSRARPPRDDAPIALVTHGLEGGSDAPYVLETCRALWDRGVRAVAMNFRTCSGEPNRLARFYHAGDTDDVAFVLDLLAGRFPGVPLAAVGYSLGGNVLLKYLGERGEQARVRVAAGISVPFDLGAGADKLQSTAIGRTYTGVFIRPMKAKFRQKLHMLADACDIERVLAARSFREFDDAATARLHGFSGADDYYARSSCGQFVPRIRVPTLLIHAEDDPFIPEAAIPREAIRANPCLTAVITPHGGHVGFVAGPPWRPEFWAEAEAARFVADILKC